MLDANDTMTVPISSPNTAPAARVRMVAPGSDSAVAATYTSRYTPITNAGCDSYSAANWAWLDFRYARLK
jgi:hypothetical protein